MDPSAVLPVFNADGTWSYPFAPGWSFTDNPPSQDAIPEWADYRVTGNVSGAVVVQRIRVPTGVPNVGFPGTSINVRTVAESGIHALGVSAPSFLDAIIGIFRAQGETVIGGAIYQYAIAETGPDLLGWEIDVVMPAPAGAQIVAPRRAEAQVTLAVVIGAFIALYFFLDDITGGAFSQFVGNAISSLANGVSQVVAAPFQGAAELLLVGGALVLGIAFLAGSGRVSPEAVSAAGGAVGAAGQGGGAILGGGGSILRAEGQAARAAARAASGGGRRGRRRS